MEEGEKKQQCFNPARCGPDPPSMARHKRTRSACVPLATAQEALESTACHGPEREHRAAQHSVAWHGAAAAAGAGRSDLWVGAGHLAEHVEYPQPVVYAAGPPPGLQLCEELSLLARLRMAWRRQGGGMRALKRGTLSTKCREQQRLQDIVPHAAGTRDSGEQAAKAPQMRAQRQPAKPWPAHN